MSTAGTAQISSGGSKDPTARRLRRLDVLGLLLFGTTIGWTYAAAAASGGNPAPAAALVAACGLTLLAGRVLGAFSRTLVPIAVVVIAAIFLIALLRDADDVGSFLGLGTYANADGAFFVQAAVAGAMVTATSRTRAIRVAAVVGTIAFALVPLVLDSWAATILIMLIPALLLARRVGGGSLAIAAVASLLVGALVLTLLLGATYHPGPGTAAVAGVSSQTAIERRLSLWHDAVTIMVDHWQIGVGPGRFALASPIARADQDARWAHNEFLQRGAETGVPGGALLVALFIWGFVRLAATDGEGVVPALGAVSLAALGIHSCVDYVMHFPAVPIAAAALVGSAMVTRARTRVD